MAKNRITEADLSAAGIVEDPDNPGQTVRLKDHDAPHEKMSLSELAVCISRAGQRADRFAKGESVERFTQGHAIALAHHHPDMKHGMWGKWCATNGIDRTTANRAERLYESAINQWGDKALENVCQHKLTDLYLRFRILPSPATKSGQNNGQPNSSHGGSGRGQPNESNRPGKLPPLEDFILGFVAKHQAGLSQAELVTEALKSGFKSGSNSFANMVHKTCTRLVKKNKLSRDDSMKYHLVQPPTRGECRHKLGCVTSMQVASAINYLQTFNEALDTCNFQITAESLQIVSDLLDGIKKKLPTGGTLPASPQPDLEQYQPEQIPALPEDRHA